MSVKCPFCKAEWGSSYTKLKKNLLGIVVREQVFPGKCCTGQITKQVTPLGNHISGLGRKNPHRSHVQRQAIRNRGLRRRIREHNERRLKRMQSQQALAKALEAHA